MTPLVGFDLDHLRLTTVATDGAVHVGLEGFLDYDSADHFLAVTTESLAAYPGLRHLHLDCGALSGVDSMGLATLLMLHRRTVAAGVTLSLDNRTPALNRLLDITGTHDHLTAGHRAPEHARHDTDTAGEVDGLPDAQHMAYRHTSKDGTPANSRSAESGINS